MNNRQIGKKLIDRLKEEFDIPFTINVINQNKEVRFSLHPSNDDESLFDADVCVRDNIRYNAVLKPQTYGRPFVATMEKADPDMKAVFEFIVGELKKNGCGITVRLNGNIVNEDNITSWPCHWDKIEVAVTKSPFFFLEGTDEEAENLISLSTKVVSLFLALVPIETRDETSTSLYEGRKKDVRSSRYERNPVARKICLEKRGCKCFICGFDFEREYGEIGKGFIEVHHITPISAIGHEYVVVPENDLIPLCSNCHSMIHRKNPPYLPKEIVEMRNTALEKLQS